MAASVNAGKIIAYWDLPHISYSSTDPQLADKVTYNTLVRLISPSNLLAEAILEVFQYYQVGVHKLVYHSWTYVHNLLRVCSLCSGPGQ